ncbi:hypothetical protein BC830DRAFT_1133136 [Chytriomyces sp. MP71]|nr:hypothetical protein BC830DRAFT_1133136 [Chytriomyces sp. MP71]
MDPLDPSQDYDHKAARAAPPLQRRPRPPPPPPAPTITKPRAPPPPLPPLPPIPSQQPESWTEHVAPNGVAYLYNAITGETRWRNPVPVVVPMEAAVSQPASQQEPELSAIQETPEVGEEPKLDDDRERAVALKKLPNTDWAIVLTYKDHEYFLNMRTAEAVWEMPDEVAELVGQIMAGGYEGGENEVEVNKESEVPIAKDYDQLEDDTEVVRVYGDKEDTMGQHQLHLAIMQQHQLSEANAEKESLKRKEVLEDNAFRENEKRAKVDWGEEGDKTTTSLKRELNNAEKQTMFMDMLRELDVNPFSTYDKELPRFSEDPRATQIALPKTCKHFFDLYCKTRAQELQQSRANTPSPKDAFRALLAEVLVGTDARRLALMSAYDEFARKWRGDARFKGVSDDRDRKALFKEFAAAAKSGDGERRKAEKKKMEEAFFEAVKSVKGVGVDSKWRDVSNASRWNARAYMTNGNILSLQMQREIDRDPRFLAVPTPIQREELFREFIKKLRLESASSEAERRELERKAREEASLREREGQVRKQKQDLHREVAHSQHKLLAAESLALFRALLIDCVKSHRARWDDPATREDIMADARWIQIRLKEYEIAGLFEEHTRSLFARRVEAFGGLVDARTSITTTFEESKDALLKEPVTMRLECTEREVRELYENHQAERERKARSELEECLKENGFVRFQVKSAVGNCHVAAVDKGLKEAEDGAEWALIGLDELKAVLKEDKRYNDFECFTAERDRIVFSFVKTLIEQYRAEKGGVLDSIVSRNAGGHADMKRK